MKESADLPRDINEAFRRPPQLQKLDEEYTRRIKQYLAGSAHPLRRA